MHAATGSSTRLHREGWLQDSSSYVASKEVCQKEVGPSAYNMVAIMDEPLLMISGSKWCSKERLILFPIISNLAAVFAVLLSPHQSGPKLSDTRALLIEPPL